MRIFGGAITVVGPQGFCVDRSASQDAERTAFVLLASCAVLGGQSAPRRPALLAVSASAIADSRQPLAVSFADMAVFFQSERGRAILARSGQAADVDIVRISTRDEVMFLRLRDRSPLHERAVEPDYWRAILRLRGRLVSLSVIGLRGKPVSEADGRRLLDDFVARVQSANPGG